ncbi:hypothetical protein [Bacillus sp. FJAT-27245]|nr:hypothetical protein [Bacillus sp. FJAT-27245]
MKKVYFLLLILLLVLPFSAVPTPFQSLHLKPLAASLAQYLSAS